MTCLSLFNVLKQQKKKDENFQLNKFFISVNTSRVTFKRVRESELTLGNEKNGIATIINSKPHRRKPNHHMPINLLSV